MGVQFEDCVSENSQGVEVHELSETGEQPKSPDMESRRKALLLRRQNRKVVEPKGDKSPVDPCKYKTKLCRSWVRDGYCSYESVCCFAHGESDIRTVHQNAQVLSSLGYFSELMLLAIENECKGGESGAVASALGSVNLKNSSGKTGRRPSKEDLRAAQAEASLLHFARTSANSRLRHPAPPAPVVARNATLAPAARFPPPAPLLQP
eukprot:EG_transcript_28536